MADAIAQKQASYIFNPGRRKAKRFSTEEIIKYAEMYAAGHTLQEVATLCEVDFSRVCGAVNKGVGFRSLKPISRFNRSRIRFGLKPRSWKTAAKHING